MDLDVSTIPFEVNYNRNLSSLVRQYNDDEFTFRWMDKEYKVADSGAIEEALDRIIEIQESLTADIITFIINSVDGETEYTALEGMTWEEWINSRYNVDEYYLSNSGVCHPIGDGVGYDGVRVTPFDVIVADRFYDGDM